MQNLLYVISLDDDEVEILFSPLQEMRLIIEDIFYEEFIALCERICSVSNGLSDDTNTAQLETKFYASNPNSINLEDFPYDVQEIYVCIICQT